jgi:hypothetical protein
MALWQRALIVPGVIACFWPDLMVEVAGVALILAILGLNWAQARKDRDRSDISAPNVASRPPKVS